MVDKIDASGLEIFVVINSDGQFFRAKGFGGSGATWVDDIKSAKIYGKVGSARSRVTWFANHYPNFPVPKIVKLTAWGTEIMDETKRVKKTQRAQEQRQLKAKKAQTERERKALQKREVEIRAQLKALEDDDE